MRSFTIPLRLATAGLSFPILGVREGREKPHRGAT